MYSVMWDHFSQPKLEDHHHQCISTIIVAELEFQEGRQGNRKLWDMHPVRDFHGASHTWLSEVSLWTYRCRQQRQFWRNSTVNTNTRINLSIIASWFLYKWLTVFADENFDKNNQLQTCWTDLVSTSFKVFFLFLAHKISPFEILFGVLEQKTSQILSLYSWCTHDNDLDPPWYC